LFNLPVFGYNLLENYRFKTSFCCLAICIVFILLPAFALGQTCKNGIEDRIRLTEITMIAGYGEGNIDDGIYHHTLLTLNIGFDLAPFFPQLERHRGITSVFLEPKINPVLGPETGVEFGISFGIKHRISLSETWHVYLMGSVGPH
jgi:hypothetical protein